MASAYIFVIICGLLALGYGVVTSRSVLAANAGTARMQEISGAVQLGASASLYASACGFSCCQLRAWPPH